MKLPFLFPLPTFGVPGALTIVCANPPQGTVGVAYSHAFPATGGIVPYSFSIVAGALPPGLSLDAGTGVASGVPTQAGTFSFTVQVTDAFANQASVICSITIINPLSITCNNPPSGSVGVPYSHPLTVSGGTPPYVFSVTAGSLPPGLSLDTSTGVISGTPTQQGNFPFTVSVTDQTSTTVICSITVFQIGPPLVFTCGSPPLGFLGLFYTHTLVFTGWTPPEVFVIVAGVLPPGLTIGIGTGIISGTPTLGGTFQFSVRITDALSNTAIITCSITIVTSACPRAFPLRQTDAFSLRAFAIDYTTYPQQPPEQWMQSTQPPPSFDLDAVPPVVGQYEVLSVDASDAFNITAPVTLAVPDDWSWVIKWGALADLLSREAHAKDTLRATYAEQRFAQGQALMATSPATLAVRVNNIPIALDAVRNGDDFNPEWQAATPGAPESAYTIGLNLIGFGPSPDPGPYSATFSVVENAPVPTVLTDYIQIDRSLYDTILDYAQHLAMFKAGGAEFIATIPAFQNLLKKAALYNSKLLAMGFFEKEMQELSQLQQERDPTYTEPNPAEEK